VVFLTDSETQFASTSFYDVDVETHAPITEFADFESTFSQSDSQRLSDLNRQETVVKRYEYGADGVVTAKTTSGLEFDQVQHFAIDPTAPWQIGNELAVNTLEEHRPTTVGHRAREAEEHEDVIH